MCGVVRVGIVCGAGYVVWVVCVVCVCVCVHWGTFIWKFCLGRTLVPDLVGGGGGWGGRGGKGILKITI